jgi:2-oxoglutarate ferredoxin oxidoreductase subunit beta
MTRNQNITAKDLVSDQDIRWCPGCGDYSILKQMQSVLPDAGIPREKLVFISGIGCSSRFPYYMNTYGMHSIHGRAPSIATGLKLANPDLSIWVITGDGDGLSIGGNHLIHILRRNVDVNILLFNNEIYGLTKGQYSPTSEVGMTSKSSPLGTVDHPFNPVALALGADATFVARGMDRDPKHLREILSAANNHKGSSFIEVYQNCNVFNDGAFELFTDKATKASHGIFLEEGKPMLFDNGNKGIRLDGLKPVIVDMDDEWSENDLLVHDPLDQGKAHILSRLFDDEMPRPFGVIYREERFTYDEALLKQVNQAIEKQGEGDLDELIRGKNSWVVKG